MLASVLLWLWPRVCELSLIGCQDMLASVLLWLWPRVCAVVNWMSSYARFCASMVVATCVCVCCR